MSAIKKKSETCGEQLRRMCKNIADGITNPVTSNDEQEDGSVDLKELGDIETVKPGERIFQKYR